MSGRRTPYRPLVAIGAVAVVAGIALTAVERSVAVVIVGLLLLGFGGVLLVSLAFLAVGESEDRHREQHPHG